MDDIPLEKEEVNLRRKKVKSEKSLIELTYIHYFGK